MMLFDSIFFALPFFECMPISTETLIGNIFLVVNWLKTMINQNYYLRLSLKASLYSAKALQYHYVITLLCYEIKNIT